MGRASWKASFRSSSPHINSANQAGVGTLQATTALIDQLLSSPI